MADGLKLLLKEDFKPKTYDWYAYIGGAVGGVRAGAAGVRRGAVRRRADPGQLFPGLAGWFGDRAYPMQIANLDAGLLIVFAFGGMTIIGAMLAGWSSANKYSLLGALRAVAR